MELKSELPTKRSQLLALLRLVNQSIGRSVNKQAKLSSQRLKFIGISIKCFFPYRDFEQECAAYSDISDQTVSNLLANLQQTTQYLLEHVKERQWSEALLADLLTRSRTEGFLWCIVLGGVLKDLKQLDVPFESTVLLAEVQSLANLEEKECQTFNALISHVNGIYELKVLTEQYTRLLHEESDEGGE